MLKRDGGSVEIRYRRLDVGEAESVGEFTEWFADEHGGGVREGKGGREGKEGREGTSGLSVLINNAGIWEGDSFGESKWNEMCIVSGTIQQLVYSTQPPKTHTPTRPFK